MKILSLLCNNCGAPLEVKEGTRFCTCAFCGTPLKIQDTGNAVYSELMETLDSRTQKIEKDVNTIKLQNELAQLDREWQATQSQYQIKGKDGHYSIPDRRAAYFAGGIGVVGGVMFTIFSASITGGFARMGGGSAIIGIFPLFGLVFAGFGIFAARQTLKKVDAYEQHREAYLEKRHRLLHQIERNS